MQVQDNCIKTVTSPVVFSRIANNAMQERENRCFNILDNYWQVRQQINFWNLKKKMKGVETEANTDMIHPEKLERHFKNKFAKPERNNNFLKDSLQAVKARCASIS